MGDLEKQTLKDAAQAGKYADEEANRLDKEQLSKKAYLVKEQVIVEASKARETKRAEKHAAEEINQLDRDQERRKAYLAREKIIVEAQEAKKLKVKKQSQG